MLNFSNSVIRKYLTRKRRKSLPRDYNVISYIYNITSKSLLSHYTYNNSTQYGRRDKYLSKFERIFYTYLSILINLYIYTWQIYSLVLILYYNITDKVLIHNLIARIIMFKTRKITNYYQLIAIPIFVYI